MFFYLLTCLPTRLLSSFIISKFKVLWGGRWQEGAGGTTGEEVEQIKSHFSRLGNSTKHMLPEGT